MSSGIRQFRKQIDKPLGDDAFAIKNMFRIRKIQFYLFSFFDDFRFFFCNFVWFLPYCDREITFNLV